MPCIVFIAALSLGSMNVALADTYACAQPAAVADEATKPSPLTPALLPNFDPARDLEEGDAELRALHDLDVAPAPPAEERSEALPVKLGFGADWVALRLRTFWG